jgi:uncharacterized membrane protein YdjX (TVP38/TMEM64 family)
MEFRVSDKPVGARGQTWRWLVLAVYSVVLIGLAVVWREPSMRHWLDPQSLSEMGRALLATPLGPVAVMGGYVLAVMLGMPVLVLITVGALIFTPWPGMFYALCGMVLGSVVTYGIGRYTGAQTVDRWTKGRLALFSEHVRQRGLLTVIMVRVMPVAPFIVVNMALGALRVPLRDYVLGSFLGLMPGTIVISLFMGQLTQAWQSPGMGRYAIMGGVALLLGTGFWWLRKRTMTAPR